MCEADARRAVDVDRLVSLVKIVDPEVTPATIAAVVNVIAASPRTLKRLVSQVAASPRLLVAPDTSTSRLGFDFVAALDRSGVAGVAHLSCPACGSDEVPLRHPHPKGRQCERCYRRAAREECAGCGQLRAVSTRVGGQAWCKTCTDADPQSWASCAGCGQIRAVTARNGDEPLCSPCRRRRSPSWGPDGAQRQRRQVECIADVVAKAADLAGVPWSAANTIAVLEHAASSPLRRAQLANHLFAHPGALIDGEPRGPLVVGDFIDALSTAGVESVRRWACDHCGRMLRLPHPQEGGRRVCARCFSHTLIALCTVCGQNRQVAARREGRAVCARCHHKAKPLEACSVCGRTKRVADRQGSAGGPRCARCRRRDRSTWRECGRCGREAPVARTDPQTKIPLCPTCYEQPTGKCDMCGRLEPIRSRRGLAICVRCYRGPWAQCARCLRTDWCYHEEGETLVCQRCLLRSAMIDLVAGPVPGRATGWEPLVEMLAGAPFPKTQLRWLRHSEGAQVVRRSAENGLAPSHELLDEAAGTRAGAAGAVEHLRSLLVTTGAIPARDNRLARLESGVERKLAEAHTNDRRIVEQYAQWHVLARARKNAEAAGLSHGRRYSAMRQIGTVTDFLAWLRQMDCALDECSQFMLDRYFVDYPEQRRGLLRFLRWAHRHRHLPDITVPSDRYRAPRARFTPGERERLLRDALTDESWQLRERAAACLILLYGLSPSQIVTLSQEHVHYEGTHIQLSLGRVRIELPSRVADLVRGLPNGHRDGANAGPAASSEEWLFPGDRIGAHLDPTSLSRMMRRRGISPRRARNTTLSDLAAIVPVPVLVRLLGVSAITAQNWRDTCGKVPGYVNDRLSMDRSPQGREARGRR